MSKLLSAIAETKMKVGSLFTGIGGLDYGFEKAGFKIVWQCEIDERCRQVLERHWKGITKYTDVGKYYENIPAIDVLIGGDPCQPFSKAKCGRQSRAKDMSGWFFAWIVRTVPRWVIRENVPGSNIKEFGLALELLGYRTVILKMDSRYFTCQSRKRYYFVGCIDKELYRKFYKLVKQSCFKGNSKKVNKKKTLSVPCLTAHWSRLDTSECYIYETGRGIRVLSIEEREKLQGFPVGWTEGLPKTVAGRLIGNAVTVPVAKWIADRIKEAEEIKNERI